MQRADLYTMLDYAEKQQSRLNYAMLLFLADTGCRVGEMCSLRAEKVNFETREAIVVGKTGERIVDFTERTSHVLQRILEGRTTGFVFLEKGKPISIFSVYARFRWIAKKLGIQRFNPHSIRHLVGQFWVDEGANLELVRLKLGHRDIDTTARYYANQDRSRIKVASEKFSLIKSGSVSRGSNPLPPA